VIRAGSGEAASARTFRTVLGLTLLICLPAIAFIVRLSLAAAPAIVRSIFWMAPVPHPPPERKFRGISVSDRPPAGCGAAQLA